MDENKTRIGRPEKAGEKMGESIIEMVHLMYQNKTALKFLNALHDKYMKK